MAIRHSIKESFEKNSVTWPMKYIVLTLNKKRKTSFWTFLTFHLLRRMPDITLNFRDSENGLMRYYPLVLWPVESKSGIHFSQPAPESSPDNPEFLRFSGLLKDLLFWPMKMNIGFWFHISKYINWKKIPLF